MLQLEKEMSVNLYIYIQSMKLAAYHNCVFSDYWEIEPVLVFILNH